MKKTLQICVGAAMASALAGCAAHQAPVYGNGAPMKAPYQARMMVRNVLQVYSVSPGSMVVGGGPLGSNPGADFQEHPGLVGLTFTDNADPPSTFAWHFDPGTKLLDRTCAPVSQAAIVAAAAEPGDKSAIFYVYLDAKKQPVAPAKMQFWNRVKGMPSDCAPEEAPAK